MYNEDDRIVLDSNDVVIELKDGVTFWGDLYGTPENNSSLVSYINNLLANKQDLTYYIAPTEASKDSIINKGIGTVVYVRETKSLYIYDPHEESRWVLINKDLLNYYDKSEVDNLLTLKADVTDVYSKLEADAKFATLLNLSAHINDKGNPHKVTKAQIGLDKVENLSPSEFPVPTAVQDALVDKQNTITGAASTITVNNLPTNKIVITSNAGKITTTSQITLNELNNLQGSTSNLQNQINRKENAFTKNTAFNKNFASNAIELRMNGIASVGSSDNVARADHIHPSDINKIDKNNDIIAGTATKITYDAKGLVTSGTTLSASDVPDLSAIYEIKGNKVGSITNSNVDYPNTKAVKKALDLKANLTYVNEQVDSLNVEIQDKENAFDKNTAFNKDFAIDVNLIKSNGTPSLGLSDELPRADHVHPSDYNKEDIVNKTNEYVTSSTLTYPSSYALNAALNTKLSPSNIKAGNNILITQDGTNVIITGLNGSGVDGTTDHNVLVNRDKNDQHPISAITDLQSNLNGKQPILTSNNAGTGITITGTGSNVKISSAQSTAQWGNILGTMSNQTDLQRTLDAKSNKRESITDTSSSNITLSNAKANTVYHYGTLTNLTINNYDISDDEIIIYFTAGSSISVNLPASMKYIGSVPVFEANKQYVINILNGILVSGEIV